MRIFKSSNQLSDKLQPFLYCWALGNKQPLPPTTHVSKWLRDGNYMIVIAVQVMAPMCYVLAHLTLSVNPRVATDLIWPCEHGIRVVCA